MVSIDSIFIQPEPIGKLAQYATSDGFYDPTQLGIEIKEVIDFPAGRYFLGDPCYALSQEHYDLVSDLDYDSYVDINGLGRVAVFCSRGDGYVVDEEGVQYSLDSGTIGVVPVDGLMLQDLQRLKRLGRIVDFDSANRPVSPYVDENGYDCFESAFQAQVDSFGNIFLGWSWIVLHPIDEAGDQPCLQELINSSSSEYSDLSDWGRAQEIKRWFERICGAMPPEETLGFCLCFIAIYLSQIDGSIRNCDKLNAWAYTFAEYMSVEIRLDGCAASEAMDSLREEIAPMIYQSSSSDAWLNASKAAAECATGFCLEISESYSEQAKEISDFKQADLYEKFRLGWDVFYDEAFGNRESD